MVLGILSHLAEEERAGCFTFICFGTVCVLCFFLMMLCVDLQTVIVAFLVTYILKFVLYNNLLQGSDRSRHTARSKGREDKAGVSIYEINLNFGMFMES